MIGLFNPLDVSAIVLVVASTKLEANWLHVRELVHNVDSVLFKMIGQIKQLLLFIEIPGVGLFRF